MRKIVINSCFGGFGLSKIAKEKYLERKGDTRIIGKRIFDNMIKRDDPDLVAVVEELGSYKASGEGAELKIVEIPEDVEWGIGEHGGIEHVYEKHRVWR